jgi:hypothetical protein
MTDSKSSRLPAINILILAAAKTPVQQGESSYPMCLTEINGISLLECIVRNTQSIANAELVFTFLEGEVQHFHLDKVVSLLAVASRSKSVPEQTQGSACTALLAACQLDQSAELLIVSANELVDDDLGAMVSDFRKRGLDAGTLTFHSVHPRYSFVSLDEDGLVIEAAQREPISTNATVGVFWFARTADFVDGTQNLIRKGSCVDGSYFVASVFNELILNQKKIGVSPLALEKYTPLKTEQQIDRYGGSHR